MYLSNNNYARMLQALGVYAMWDYSSFELGFLFWIIVMKVCIFTHILFYLFYFFCDEFRIGFSVLDNCDESLDFYSDFFFVCDMLLQISYEHLSTLPRNHLFQGSLSLFFFLVYFFCLEFVFFFFL